MNILDKICIFLKTAFFLWIFFGTSFLFADQYFFGCIDDSSGVKRLKNQSFELNLEDEIDLLEWQNLITDKQIFLLNLRDDIEFVIFGLDLFGRPLTKELIMNPSDTNQIRFLVQSTSEPIRQGFIDLFDKLLFVKNLSDDGYERHELIVNTHSSIPRVDSSVTSDGSDGVKIEEASDDEDFFGRSLSRAAYVSARASTPEQSAEKSPPKTETSSKNNNPDCKSPVGDLPKKNSKTVVFSAKKIAFVVTTATTLFGAVAWRKRSRRVKRIKNISLKEKNISVGSKPKKYILNLK